ncbi:MAG: hypothetical protein U0840_24175 [Gemmataceae bacterium]
MSFDPFGNPPASQPPGSGLPPAYSSPVYSTPIRDRVQLPALFLIAIAVLNVLVSFYTGFETTRALVTPADKLYNDAVENANRLGDAFPTLKKQMGEAMEKQTPEGLRTQVILQFGIPTIVILMTSLLMLFGGVRMMQLRSYGLCVLVSILAATPCISPMGCCCMGNIAGIWSLIVLLSPEVRSSFQ